MDLDKKNIVYVAGTKFYISKKRPTVVSYKKPIDRINWEKIEIDFIDDVIEPLEHEILFYYNDLRSKIVNIKELNENE